MPPAGPDDGEPVVPPPGPDAEPPALINFDNLEHGTLVGGQYPGAFFSAGGFRAPAVWDFRVISHNFREAVSPPCSLSRKNTGDSSWDHFSPITVDFTRPVNNLKFNTTSIDAPAGTIVARVDVFQSGTYTRTINIPSFGWGTYTTYSFAPTGEFPSGINNITRIVINQTRDAFGAYADDSGLTYDDFIFTPALSVNITCPRASGNIQGTTQTALPGADLVLRADTNDTGGAYRWTFTGPITVSGGSVNSNTVTLRATDAGAVTARVTYTMNGYTVASSVNINVVLPRLTAFSAVEAADRIISPDVEQCQGLPLLHTAYILGCPYYVFQAPEHVPGIKFTAVAALPAGPYLTDPAQGGIKFVQIMSSLRKAMLYGGPVCETSRPSETDVAAGWQLDTTDPYSSAVHRFSEGTTLTAQTEDSPRETLTDRPDNPFSEYDALYVDEAAEMYVLYFAGANPSVPTFQRPIGFQNNSASYVPWAWGGLVTFNPASMTFKFSLQSKYNYRAACGAVEADHDPLRRQRQRPRLRPLPGRPPLTTNLIDAAKFFVRQHYLDFFNREPDEAGWDFWRGQITECAFDADCISRKRVDVARAFFFSDAFAADKPLLRADNRGTNSYNREFVRQCYYIYLRRTCDPEVCDPDGFNFWVGVLNNNYSTMNIHAYNELLNAFIRSGEYRNRFPAPPPLARGQH